MDSESEDIELDTLFDWGGDSKTGQVCKYRAKVKWRDTAYEGENFEAHLLNAKGRTVGFIRGSLLERRDPNFWEKCDATSQELEQMASTFCESDGRATKIEHPLLYNDPATVKEGGFLHIYTVEIEPNLRRQFLGTQFLSKVLLLTKDFWTLAVAQPATLRPGYCRWKDNANTSYEEAMKKVFARVGFIQAGRTIQLSRCFFLTHKTQKLEKENWLTDEELSKIVIF